VVQIIKSISAREVFKKFPELRKQLWAGELWNDGYFVRGVGDKVTADIIRKYIEYQAHEDASTQPNMFGNPQDASQLAGGLFTLRNGGEYRELGGNYFDECNRLATVRRIENLGYQVKLQPV